MCPEKMVTRVEELAGELMRLVSAVRYEGEDIAEQWEGLRRVGGQRADHAAQLLARLRPALDELAKLSSAASKQITGMVADPFCRLAEVA